MNEVRRQQSNLLIEESKKLGFENSFQEVSPTTFKNFIDRFEKKYHEGWEKKYIKSGIDKLTVTIEDSSFIEHGRGLLLALLDPTEKYFLGAHQSFLFESTVFEFLEIMNACFEESDTSSPMDGFIIYHKKLEWFIKSTTVRSATQDDSVALIGDEASITRAHQKVQGFSKVWTLPNTLSFEKNKTERDELI